MDIRQALQQRRSVRAFLPQTVDGATVRELLETFAPPGVAAQLDYATLRRENGHYVTPALKQREQDVV